jgi:hypothetical protein
MADPSNERAVPALLGKVIAALNKQNKILEQTDSTGKGGGPTPAAKKQAGEDAKASANKHTSLLQQIADGVGGGSKNASEAKKSGKLGGMLGGLGKAVGSMGIGAGVAMGGLGALFAGGGYLLKQLAEFDGKAVVANVRELFKIAELTDGIGDAFVKGGSFFVAMFGLGLGLAVFGAGAVIASAGGALSKFLDPNWAQSIVDNVVILLGLKDALGGNWNLLADGVAFTVAMFGIGVGLGFFGAGAAIASAGGALSNFINPNWAQSIVDNVVILLGLKDALGGNWNLLADGVAFTVAMMGIGIGLGFFGVGAAAAGLSQFLTKDDWALRVKNSVITLLSIKDALGSNWDMLKSSGAFALSMIGIGVGLAAFVAGKAATGLAQFMIPEDWASKVKSSVVKLLEIANLSFGDVAKFTGFMTAIAAGLVAFAVGKGANAMGDVIGKFTGNFADNIVKDVNTLLAMVNDPNTNLEKAKEFSAVMGHIAGGLLKFAAGGFTGTLAGAASAALSFLTGTKSPVTQMQEIAKNAKELERGSNAISKIAEGFDRIGRLKFDGSRLNIADFTEDLLESVPNIEIAIMGGTITKGRDRKIKGLASDDIKFEQASINMSKLRASLGMETTTAADLKGGSTTQDKLLNSIEALTAAISASAGGTNVLTNSETTHNAMGAVSVVPIQPIKHMIANGSGGPPR